MADPSSGAFPAFDIHASVVFQLGESLISDSVQALVELVKNSYDADASYCRVVINTRDHPPDGAVYADGEGYILVEDDGFGMDAEAIKRGWLVVSSSPKREMKRRSETTPKGRTPLGDKGVGRLGVQRLGHTVEILTRKVDADDEYRVAFSWDAFADEVLLSHVRPYVFERRQASRHPGTTLLVSGIKDAATWQGAEITRLQSDLSRLLSPYRVIRDFVVSLEVDGTVVDLVEITDVLRRVAQVRYQLIFDGRALAVSGQARLEFFRPSAKERDSVAFDALVCRDNGARLLGFLASSPAAKDMRLSPSADEGWFVDYGAAFALPDVDNVWLVGSEIANPGPFTGEVDVFDLASDAEVPEVFSRLSEFRKYMTRFSGIRVYRDGFGIRVDQDWLKLAGGSTSGRSFYGLRPGNTMGYIALSARDNAQLEELTNREGFGVTPHYRNFYALLQEFVQFTAKAHSSMRRQCLAFMDDEAARALPGSGPRASEELAHQLDQALARADGLSGPVSEIAQCLGSISEAALEALGRTCNSGALEDADAAAIVKRLQELQRKYSVEYTAAQRPSACGRRVGGAHPTACSS